MSRKDLKDLILLARSAELRYKLDQYEDGAVKELLHSVDLARNRIAKTLRQRRYQRQFSGPYTKFDERSKQLFNELEDLTLGLRNKLGQDMTQMTTVAGEMALDSHNDILSFGGRVDGFNFVRLTAEQIRQMVTGVPVGGHLLSDWVDRTVSGRIKAELKREIMAGMFAGSGYPGIIKRIHQIMGDETRRNVITLARTYVHNINTSAAESVYRANGDIIKELEWSAVLEPGYSATGRGTCIRCAALDGTRYKLSESHPPIPLHGRCRCVLTPVTKTWRELGLDIDEIEEAYRPYTIRANKNIDAGLNRTILEHGFHGGNYAEWFAGRGKDFQRNVVGPGRLALLESGKIDFADLVDKRTGRLLTLEELESGRHRITGSMGMSGAPMMVKPLVAEVKPAEEAGRKESNVSDFAKQIAKESGGWYDEGAGRFGAAITMPATKKVSKARKEAIDKLIAKMEEIEHLVANKNGYNYVKSALLGMKKKGVAGVVQLDMADVPIAATSIDAVLDDAIHGDVLGSFLRGGGQSAIYRSVKYSQKIGKKGAIKIYAIGDINTIMSYVNIGFEEIPGTNDGRNMWLSPEVAEKFARDYEEKWYGKGKK